MLFRASIKPWVPFTPKHPEGSGQRPLRRAGKPGAITSVRAPLYPICLLCMFLLMQACGQDQQEGFEGTDAPTIIKIRLTPTSFVSGPVTGIITGLFSYVDPNADLANGIFVIRECGQDPEQRLDVPFKDIDRRTVGVFVVELQVSTDCQPGDYSALFSVIDERGNTSNTTGIHYTIEPP